MTQEEKQLLFIDLCARLPYYPYALFDLDKKFDGGFQAPIIGMVNKGNTGVIKYNQEFYAYGCMTPFSIEEFRIYLRPISSMTEEEKKELKEISFEYLEKWENAQNSIDKWRLDAEVSYKRSEFYNSHLLDWRGLIPKGLALEASEDMYKIN